VSSDLFNDVSTMYLRFGFTGAGGPRRLPHDRMYERVKFLKEELAELEDAIANRDLAGQADALVDLVVVALGTAALLNLPFAALWDDVHRANCAKVVGVDRKGRGGHGGRDLSKPPGWQPPDPEGILARYGYDPEEALTVAVPLVITEGQLGAPVGGVLLTAGPDASGTLTCDRCGRSTVDGIQPCAVCAAGGI
jgi:predicted HAD superfamily Cof-like phosphohydrolase